MTSRLEKKDTRRWFLPVPTLIGKLGEPNGPSLADVLKDAELRQAFLKGLPLPGATRAASNRSAAAPTPQADHHFRRRGVGRSGAAAVCAAAHVYDGLPDPDDDINSRSQA